MYSNLDDNNDDHDLAIWIACKKFEEMYPKETQRTIIELSGDVIKEIRQHQ